MTFAQSRLIYAMIAHDFRTSSFEDSFPWFPYPKISTWIAVRSVEFFSKNKSGNVVENSSWWVAVRPIYWCDVKALTAQSKY